ELELDGRDAVLVRLRARGDRRHVRGGELEVARVDPVVRDLRIVNLEVNGDAGGGGDDGRLEGDRAALVLGLVRIEVDVDLRHVRRAVVGVDRLELVDVD